MTEQQAPTLQYADRDPMALDKAGNYYIRHVSAMTREGLHSKADIAAELAWRDCEIDRLRRAKNIDTASPSPVSLPPVPRELVFQHFGTEVGHPLLRTSWKDGIDLEVPTHSLQTFAEAYARLATPQPSPTGSTEADIRVLRQANTDFAMESHELQDALAELYRQIKAFAEEQGEADFETGDALRLLCRLRPLEYNWPFAPETATPSLPPLIEPDSLPAERSAEFLDWWHNDVRRVSRDCISAEVGFEAGRRAAPSLPLQEPVGIVRVTKPNPSLTCQVWVKHLDLPVGLHSLYAAPSLPAVLTDAQILDAATKEFPDWRVDIQEQFVLRVVRAALATSATPVP